MIGCLSDLVSIDCGDFTLRGLIEFQDQNGIQCKNTSCQCAKFIMCQQLFVFERLSYNHTL